MLDGGPKGLMLRDRPYIDRAPEFDIRDGVVCADFGDWSLHMPMRVFRVTHARAAKTIREHDTSGEVVPLKGRR